LPAAPVQIPACAANAPYSSVKGLMGTLLRYPYEVRDEKEYFDEVQDVKVTKDRRCFNRLTCML